MSAYNVKKILLPLDFSKTSFHALDHAVHMASVYRAGLTLMHAIESMPVISERGYFNSMAYAAQYERSLLRESNKHLKDVANRIRKKLDTPISTVTVPGRAHRVIVSTAKRIRASVIIMGTHGVSGFREFFIGSNAFRVVHDAGCPVLTISRVVRKPGFSNILMPFRDKPHSREKVDYAISMGKKYGAAIHILAVDSDDSKTTKKKLQMEAGQIKRFVEKAGLNGTIKLISGMYHADTIIRYAKRKKCDLVISMADMDKMDISEFIKGPYAQQIVNHSPIPVLSIRPKFNPKTVNLSTF